MRSSIVMLALVVSPLCYAQAKVKADSGANPVSQELKGGYERMKKLLIATAEEMPPADYAFKPTPEVRSFAQVLGHVADAQYMFCGMAKGEKMDPSKHPSAEKITTKPEMQKALADAFAFCDPVYAGLTDAALAGQVDLFGGKHSKFAVYNINLMHDDEHYGMLVTYLRMKKLVPPSSKKE